MKLVVRGVVDHEKQHSALSLPCAACSANTNSASVTAAVIRLAAKSVLDESSVEYLLARGERRM